MPQLLKRAALSGTPLVQEGRPSVENGQTQQDQVHGAGSSHGGAYVPRRCAGHQRHGHGQMEPLLLRPILSIGDKRRPCVLCGNGHMGWPWKQGGEHFISPGEAFWDRRNFIWEAAAGLCQRKRILGKRSRKRKGLGA